MKKWGLLLAAAILTTTFIVPALAQNSLDQARILFDAGVQAYTAGRYKEAVESFQEAYALSGKPQAVFSLAQAERRLYVVTQDAQYLHSAIEHFRQYLSAVPEGGRRSDAAEALEQLELVVARETKPAETPVDAPKVVTGKILISTTTPGATISVDGSKGAESPFLEVVKPGKHLVRVLAPGFISEDREIIAVENALVPLEIVLREEPSYLTIEAQRNAIITIDGRSYGPAPIRKRVESHGGAHVITASLPGYHLHRETVQLDRGQKASIKIDLERTRQRTISYVLAGAGAASFVSAGIFGSISLHEESRGEAIHEITKTHNLTHVQLDEFNAAIAARDQFRSFSLVGLSAGAILGIAGAFTYVFDSPTLADEPAPNADKIAISVTVLPSTTSVLIGGRF